MTTRPHRAALVTGSSSGIGHATAIALARRGWTAIGVHYRRNADGAEATAAAVREAGAEPFLVRGDLADADDRGRIIDDTLARVQRLDTVVHNAGADVLTGDAASLSFDEKLSAMWDVDVRGTIDLARRLVEPMRSAADPARPPSMTFIGWDQSTPTSSGAGMEGDAGQMFAPIKAAVTAFAMSLAQDIAPEIRVNVVAPGWIQTAWGETTEGYWDRRARSQSLMDRWGRPEDVAAAIRYAADPDHTFVNGQILEVNGGWRRTFDRT